MNTLVVVAHPHLADSATQQFLKASATDLPGVTWHALSGEFDVPAEQQRLEAADRIVLQFPLYWYAAPAQLKAWLDTVWTGAAMQVARGGRVAGKELGLVISLGQPLTAFRLGGAAGISLDDLARPYAALAQATGMTLRPLLPVAQFAYQSLRERQALLIAYQQYLTAASDHFADRAAWWQGALRRREPDSPLSELLDSAVADWASVMAAVREQKAGDDLD